MNIEKLSLENIGFGKNDFFLVFKVSHARRNYIVEYWDLQTLLNNIEFYSEFLHQYPNIIHVVWKDEFYRVEVKRDLFEWDEPFYKEEDLVFIKIPIKKIENGGMRC